LTPLKIGVRDVYIKGTSPLLVHRFGAKAMHQMLAKMMGVPDKKEPREPEMDYVRSLYLLPNDRFGFPASAFKDAIVRGAKHSAAMAMTDAKSSFFIRGEMVSSELGTIDMVELIGVPVMDFKPARNDGGGADFRFRGLFDDWMVHLSIECNTSVITEEQLGQMILAAGYGTGVGEMRREKGGPLGAWTLATQQEYAAMAQRVTTERAAWFAEHRDNLARVAQEDRRLMQLILTTPGALEAAHEQVGKKKKASAPLTNGQATGEEVHA